MSSVSSVPIRQPEPSLRLSSSTRRSRDGTEVARFQAEPDGGDFVLRREGPGGEPPEWGKLTDDDLERIGGKKDELIARLRERYGLAKDKAEAQVDEWLASLEPKKDRPRNQPPR